MSSVISGEMKQGTNELRKFRELYHNDLTFSNELKKLDQKYYTDRNKPCPAVKNNIEKVIASLIQLIDLPSMIIEDVKKGDKSTNQILEKYCKIFRNRIYKAYDNVNSNVLVPLQERLKSEIITVLFNNARLGRIPLTEYAVEDGASVNWLQTFINEKVDKTLYPFLNNALTFVLDYKISIEGLMEYNVAKCLDTLDKNSPAFRPMTSLNGLPDEVQAKKIWSEIVSRASLIQIAMQGWKDDFSLIPSHSFYACISMFRDMLVDDTNTAISEELYNFYSENRMSIWRKEFASIAQEAEAFGKWNENSSALAEMCKKNSFIITINN